ncbi:MAG: FAD-dependent oxidoreductase [Coriobacteriia bacterium]|nr:FAD-dependent oxidoreductase [Coriobacteriia bacterium]MBS5477042.1 FAD-dependent oxidoreductase [Coriobacteriia bacterium]
MQNDVTRRSFVSAGALGLAGLAAAGLAATGAHPSMAAESTSEVPASWDGEADVVVCGAGGAGLTAAYAALEQGATVIVLEKGDFCGGTTATAEGAIQASGTTWQKELGKINVEDDNADKHFAFWMTDAEGLCDEKLVRQMADNAADNLQWMADSFGITYSRVFGPLPTPYQPEENIADRIHIIADADDPTSTGGVVWTTKAETAVTEKGGQILTGTAASSLVVDGENGVVGVMTADGKAYHALSGVVLAMAGIEHNEELAKRYNPQHYWDLMTQSVVTSPNDTGDGIVMGLAAGADMGRVGGCVDLILATGSCTNNTNPEMPAIFVSMRGNRFVREDTTYAFHMRSCFNSAMQEGGFDGCTWMVLDAKMTKMEQQSPWSDAIEGGAEAREAAVADGTLLQADSIEELAEAMGVPASNLAATVEAWNAGCEAGEDVAYGRVKQLVPLDEAPFFAYKIVHTNIGAIGGLRINEDCAVIDRQGEPIPHLFAAGANSAGWLGPYYPGSGTCLQGTLNTGRIAGVSAAAAK